MTELDTILYVFVCGAMLALSVLGLESAVITPSLKRWNRRFFIVFFAVLVCGSSVFFLELAGYLVASLTVLVTIAYFLQSVLYITLFPMLAVYLLYCCEEDWRESVLFRVMLALWAACLIMLITSQFVDGFYSIVPGGGVIIGPAYPLLVMPLLAMLGLLAVGVVRRRNKLPQQYFRAFLIWLIPVAVAILVHMITTSFVLIDLGLTVFIFAMYRIIVSDSVEQDRLHQQEIANQRASIAVLQMRPHFIYNTMTSIYHLTDQDPQRAKQVTMDFSTYLRKIFTAIGSDGAIPFVEELEHTRAYLAVEQAQFEDDLSVEYDTPHVKFCVPPLTLQPIVENAVKHGMDLDAGPLHVRVQTKETGQGSEIVVEDDGSGCDPAIVDDPHTTLANIRQRLQMMCGGMLDIARREGGGTVVKVTIPRAE